ncbi:MAG: CTP synthase [Candidatus Doudnabacteria bacterium RIFCSPHIGHO2_02_FULL_42_25]|uniref:CTP synthase n=1 Tax=Candidatus Doudnabacteria bacterium RIFCSPHIGHO2_01_FULL_41_86 TaxID=1817821 RepID=A0A1F5N8E0_9BACT|nr:MAG: CTP synthase [Candidatus Doudnabacteria bacterium RIFCSPHIGHO2_01_FULL_41_86]OGE75867.1 MAG: CTP synthase [Candidatus Doudnabacteria bacterium RIFCSPHIGHO2_01_43_10]OGE86241.1 MAG: CTP synthase [Candidatus Doudnabacteria bacterium RIFCSPHIGHO2_12_FULL_42_22]OGE87089.1 MAG: CTP synthase [Candidatus Doudnabacteria bacterium RIFCSPHIGHO2_02_FULL_42_25]OGE92229.1 MAG: CTP synthase [Candidatus Doudnabacteria bacterium RIFCSPLOWO2_01_FULL_42_60]OGE92942.1 MAG: CTP synthase [Candidatus Doudna
MPRSKSKSRNRTKRSTKYIFVSGGVISGLGKGITAASIAAILKGKGYTISPVKVDMYLNQDAGTIRPQEHGEVFVADDGIETDQDLGHYERFLNTNLSKVNYMTTGQVYGEVLRKERAFEYDGEDVEAIPHVTDEIIRRFKQAGKNADIVIIELGGTVGEYQNAIFFEASRIMKLRAPKDVIQVHVAYLPIPGNLGEMKSKPVQQSVRLLNAMGIEPDFIVARAEHYVDDRRKERIALFCNVKKEDVISNPDLNSIYEVPLVLQQQKFGEKILNKFNLPTGRKNLEQWRKLVRTMKTVKKEVHIGVVGKYFGTGNYHLSDVYVSIIEALKAASWYNKVKPVLHWIDSEKIEKEGTAILHKMDGIVITPGFGKRGIEGMISAINYARTKKVPYLGLCYGMQMATIEFARNVLRLKNAHTVEVDDGTPHPVINIMPDQEKKLLKRDYGASMRLGAWVCVLKPGSKAEKAYGTRRIMERHRHRYEFNNKYRKQFEAKGFVFSGTSPDGHLVEIIEIADHPFFVGVQFHPEFKSRPLAPGPLFRDFVKASIKNKK